MWICHILCSNDFLHLINNVISGIEANLKGDNTLNYCNALSDLGLQKEK